MKKFKDVCSDPIISPKNRFDKNFSVAVAVNTMIGTL